MADTTQHNGNEKDKVRVVAPTRKRAYTKEPPELPPSSAIKNWMKIHYEGTNNRGDYVNKTELLQHFRSHFNMPDHPELANTFFDKLSVLIFPADSNYRYVRTKRTKSKHSKRRLVCLRRKTAAGATARDLVDTAYAPQPVPVKRTKVLVGNQTLAKRVANMTNEQLVSRQRPPVKPDLRPVVIDGSNVAITHGCRSRFSCRGIALCVRYFLERGHGDVMCMVPNYRLGGGVKPPVTDQHLISALENAGWVKLTPSRKVNGRHIVCYDDRFIIQLAESNGGVIVSNDQYRDIMETDPDWKPVIQQQLLPFTLVGDLFMFPNDPLGRHGPSLENFLKVPMEQ